MIFVIYNIKYIDIISLFYPPISFIFIVCGLHMIKFCRKTLLLVNVKVIRDIAIKVRILYILF